MGLFDKQSTRTHKGLFPTGNDPYSLDNINNQINNANTRISDAGYSPQNADTRNSFEKFTNLPQHQNAFLDTLELLGRGGNAVKNVIDKSIIGDDDPLQSIYRGLSGKEKVTGSELAGHMGIDNKASKFVIGLGLDVGLDPTTYIPGGVIAKGIGTVAKPIGSLAKGAYGLAESASPALKAFRETKAEPFLDASKDALGRAFVPQYKWDETLTGGKDNTLKDLFRETNNTKDFMNENSMQNIGSIAKSTGLDAGTDVGRLAEKDLKQFEDVKGYEFPDGLQRTTNKNDLVNVIGQNKSTIANVSKDIKNTNKEYQGALSEFGNALDETNKQISKLYFSLERNAGKELDSATRNNLRQARTEANRLDSQINNFGQVEGSMLREFKKQVRDDHDANFNVIKEIRRVAPNGIKAVGFELPDKLKSLNSVVGKGIDEVANELGYKYAGDLLQDVRKLDGFPRKLSQAEIEFKALKEMDRVGAKQHLAETLTGLKSARDSVKASLTEVATSLGDKARTQGKAFADLSTHPEYNSLNTQKEALQAQREALRNESKLAQQSGVNKIRGIQDANDDLKQSLANPVMVQKEIPRPVREHSSDPAVLNATKKIVESNDNLRNWALDNDIPVGEIDGYMRHILSQEEQALRTRAAKTVDHTSGSMSNPDKKVLSGRKVMGSAEDINDRLGRNHTETNAYFSTAIGQKKLIDYGNSVMFRRKILGDTNFARPFKEGMTVADHHELIDTNNYSFMKNTANSLPDEIGGKYVVTKGVKEALDRYQGLATDEGTKGMLKAFDTLQNTWKKMALFSVGFHIRNVAGAMFNNTVAGMNPIQLVKYTKEASGEVMNAIKGTESPLFTEYRKQGLSSSGISQVEFSNIGEAPEKGLIKTVENMSKTGKDKVISKLKQPFQTSRELGDAGDQVNRFALFKWAVEEKGMSYKDAAQKVREVQYDYRDLTPFERNVVKRVIPFYTWSRKNIPFQLKSFINDPRAYEGVNKVRLNAQSTQGLNDENTPDFMKENFAIPLTKNKMLGLNLPLGDLTKLSSPLKTITDGISPVLKTPIEESLNYNFFKGKPIEKFAGQDKKYLGGLAIPAKLDYAIQAATGQVGRGLATALGDKGNVDQDTKFRMPSLGLSVVKPYDADKSLTFEQLAKLKQLQDYMLYIQQQEGQKPRTIAEIKKSQK